MTDQPGLFDVPEVGVLPLPRGVKAATGKIQWAEYKTKTRRCEDCELLSYERGLTREHAPAIRMARFKRTQGSQVRVLCAEHANERKAIEQTAEIQSA